MAHIKLNTGGEGGGTFQGDREGLPHEGDGKPIQTDTGGFPEGIGGGEGLEGLSPEERELLSALTGILRIQAEHLQNTTNFFAQIAPSFRDLFLAQNAYSIDSINTMRTALPQALGALSQIFVNELGPLASVSETERLATENTQKYLRGETLLTGQDLSRLDTIFGRVREQGIQDITRFGEEQAAARGLRVTDTPIGSTAQEQISDLTQGLGANRAAAELGIEQQRFSSAEAVRQFQTNLRAAATSNRAAIAAGFIPGFNGGGGGSGGSLPTVGGGADTGGGFGFLSNLSGQRNANAQAALEREFRRSESAANREFQGGEGAANREAAREGRRPGALDYVGILAGLAGRAFSFF